MPGGPNAFEPLKIPLFRDRWVASTVSSLGTWMQDTAGTWLMTVLTTSPLLIALMQTAASLPVLFLGLLGVRGRGEQKQEEGEGALAHAAL